MSRRADASPPGRRALVLADSITDLGSEAAGAVVVTGSHGGRTTASFALERRIGALIAHAAGVGLDQAGISALAVLDGFGVPCCAIDSRSARIGDARHCAANGRLAHVNDAAAALSVQPGWSVERAVERLRSAALTAPFEGTTERVAPRRLDLGGSRAVWLLDSASEVDARHAGAVVVTGSHGSLVAGRAGAAVRHPVFAAVFNDAGAGPPSRLPVLEEQGIAAVAVAAASARIGDAASTYATGIVSAANGPARRLGARLGEPARVFVALAARAPVTDRTA